MSRDRTARVLCWLAVVAAASCSSSTPGGAYLYDRDTDPPHLLDSEVRVETFRRARGKKIPDLRTVRCRGGVTSVSMHSRRNRLHGEAPLPLEAYASIWKRLSAEAWSYDSEPVDPTGGLYHVVTMTLGHRTHQFTAQDKTSFLGFGTRVIRDKLDIANAIVEVVHRHVDPVPLPPEPEGEAAKPGAAGVER